MSSTARDGTAGAPEREHAGQPRTQARGRHVAERPRGRLRALGTKPVQLVGSLMSRTQPVPEPSARGAKGADAGSVASAVAEPPATQPIVTATAPAEVPVAPADLDPVPDGTLLHTVETGESAADVAARYGVSTASVLALNGLSWKAPLRPGDVLRVRPGHRPPPGPAAASLHRHRVVEGETVSGIAASHGLATAAVLLANGLSRGSAVRAGQHLVIPVRPMAREAGGSGLTLSGEMRDNAELVVDVGRLWGLPGDAIVVALAAAMQDSSLRNLGFGEGDAVGLFQLRPSDGWGTRQDLLDPDCATRAFFGGTARPGRVGRGGLLDLDGWELMSVGEAARAVLGTSSAAAYGRWEDCARGWLRDLDR